VNDYETEKAVVIIDCGEEANKFRPFRESDAHVRRAVEMHYAREKKFEKVAATRFPTSS
jgi:hypothetical protein